MVVITPIIKRKTDKESNLLILNFPHSLVSSLVSLAFCFLNVSEQASVSNTAGQGTVCPEM
jgi:hypothetical protein